MINKKRQTKQILRNQICETCIKKLDETCRKYKLTCKKWNDYKIDELSVLAVLMMPHSTKIIKFKEWNFIRRIKLYDLEGFKIGEGDRHDFKIGPEDQLEVRHI